MLELFRAQLFMGSGGSRIFQGEPTPKGDHEKILFSEFSPETAWKGKKLDREGNSPLAPSWIRQWLELFRALLRETWRGRWPVVVTQRYPQ